VDSPYSRIEQRSGPRGAVVYADGRPLTGPDPASSMPRRLPDLQSVSPQTLFLVISPLQGHGLTEWTAALPISCAVLLVELDPDLAHMQPTIATWKAHRRIVASYSWESAVHSAEQLISRHAIRRSHTVHLTGGSRLQRSQYQDLEAHLRIIIQQYWNNRGTQIRLHRRWVSNLVRNLVRDGAPVDALRARGSRHAILVGAGPSLDHYIALLSRIFSSTAPGDAGRGAGILVAIDTALPALAAAHIQPDFVVTMDSQLANAQDFLPWQWDATAVIADATTHFSIPRRFLPSRRYWFVSRFSDVQLFRDPELRELFNGIPVVPPRGSVAPSAVHILSEIIGVSEILLIGVDFWYRPPKSHADMSSSDRWLKKSTTRIRHRDGHDRAPARPLRETPLRDGTRTWGDAILSDQARIAREVITHASGRVLQVPGPGLDIGAEHIHESAVPAWWTSGASADLCDDLTSNSAVSMTRSTELRTATLEALLRRLRVLENQLESTDPPILDSGLDFVLVDLPQWPLMTLSSQWMSLHRLRILRSVKDYRRRVEASLFGGSAEY